MKYQSQGPLILFKSVRNPGREKKTADPHCRAGAGRKRKKGTLVSQFVQMQAFPTWNWSWNRARRTTNSDDTAHTPHHPPTYLPWVPTYLPWVHTPPLVHDTATALSPFLSFPLPKATISGNDGPCSCCSALLTTPWVEIIIIQAAQRPSSNRKNSTTALSPLDLDLDELLDSPDRLQRLVPVRAAALDMPRM